MQGELRNVHINHTYFVTQCVNKSLLLIQSTAQTNLAWQAPVSGVHFPEM